LQPGQNYVCTMLTFYQLQLAQTDNHASTSPLSIFKGQMPFLSPNWQRQSTEGNITTV